IRAGRGEMTPPEEAGLSGMNHPLLLQLADPNTKPLIELFAQLPDESHRELTDKGYLKWKFADLDGPRQQAYRKYVQYVLDTFNKRQTDVPEGVSLAGLENADVGFAVLTPKSGGPKIVTLYTFLPDYQLPLSKVLVGVKSPDKPGSYLAYEEPLAAVRT